MKPRVAVFSFTGCEGCSLAILECENELLDVLNLIELVRWREAMTETSEDIDIALIDGSISTHHDIMQMKRIREMARVVVAIGACAHNGGLNALKNRYGMGQVKEIVYGDAGEQFDTVPARPVSAVVPVDFALPGCSLSHRAPGHTTVHPYRARRSRSGQDPQAPRLSAVCGVVKQPA